MCRKWPRMVHVGMEKCVYSLNAMRVGTLLAFGVGYKGLLQQTGTKASPSHAIVSIYLQAWTRHGRTRKTRKLVVSYSVWFQCQPSVNGPFLAWVRFRPSVPISVHVSTGELYK